MHRAPSASHPRFEASPAGLAAALAAVALGTAPAPSHASERVLEPGAWALLSVPGDADGRSAPELFADDLLAEDYGNGRTIFSWDGDAAAYRRPTLDKPLGTAAGFWMVQALDGPRTIRVDDAAATGVPGAACSAPACVRRSLPSLPAATGWTLAGFPSPEEGEGDALRVAAAGDRAAGCGLAAASAAGMISPNGWAWDDTGGTYTSVDETTAVPAWQAFWLGTPAGATSAALLVPTSDRSGPGDAAALDIALGRGANLGGALETPFEGDWDVTLQADDFDTIADAGLDSVRIPVSWAGYAGESPPYTLDETILERVDRVLDQAERTGLAAVPNVHHYDAIHAIHANPVAERDRFLAIWSQIAPRYAARPASVAFELLNEPNAAFSDAPGLWNALAAADALAVAREANAERAVLIGPVGFNSIDRLDTLELPDDPNLVASVQYYSPFPFTHQGGGLGEPDATDRNDVGGG